MSTLFSVRGNDHEVPFPDTDDLAELGREIYGAVISAAGDEECREGLEAEIYDRLLNALVDDTDLDLGEIALQPIAAP